MPDNEPITDPQGPGKINMNDEQEVAYWSRKFDVAHDELKAAVAAVGVSVEEVEKHLAKTDGKKSPFR